jgi:hypothetical protein
MVPVEAPAHTGSQSSIRTRRRINLLFIFPPIVTHDLHHVLKDETIKRV